MIDEILDKMIDEKMDYKEYMELANEVDDPEIKEMLIMISNQELEHYRMIKEWMKKYIKDDVE